MRQICKLGKFISCFCIAMFFCFVTKPGMQIEAASFSIGASTSSVKPGEKFTLYINASGCIGRVNISVSNGSASTNAVWIEGGGSSVTITAGSSGAVTVTATPEAGFSDDNGDPYNPGSRSVSVSIKQPQSSNSNSNANTNTNSKPSNNVSQGPKVEPQEDPRSKDNNLKSLSVSAGILSPKFSANTTSYKVNLPADATSIEIKASANDSKAKVSGVGTKKVQAGENKINIVVTSEYGTTKTYTITVNVDEKPLIYTDYNGNKLGVVRNIRGVNAPEGFKQTKVKLDGKEIPAWTNEKMNKTLIYLSDEKNEKSFYLYEEGKVTTKMTYKEIMGRKFFLVDIPKDKQSRKGMEYKEISIDKTKLMGWTYTDKAFANYSLLYVMGMDGEMHYYQYEKSENILQLYSGAVPLTQEAYDKERKDLESSKNTWMMVGILTIITTVVSAGAALYLFKKSK